MCFKGEKYNVIQMRQDIIISDEEVMATQYCVHDGIQQTKGSLANKLLKPTAPSVPRWSLIQVLTRLNVAQLQ
jgi:hypothetical protein